MSNIKIINDREFKELLLGIEQQQHYVGVYQIDIDSSKSIDAYKVAVDGENHYLFKDFAHNGLDHKAIPCEQLADPVTFIGNIKPSVELENASIINERKRTSLIGSMARYMGLNGDSTLGFLDGIRHPRIGRMLMELERLQGGVIDFTAIKRIAPSNHQADAKQVYGALNDAMYPLRYGHDVKVNVQNAMLSIYLTKMMNHGRGHADILHIPLESKQAQALSFDYDQIPYEFEYTSRTLASADKVRAFQSGRPIPLEHCAYRELYETLKHIEIVQADPVHKFIERPAFSFSDGDAKIAQAIKSKMEETGLSAAFEKVFAVKKNHDVSVVSEKGFSM